MSTTRRFLDFGDFRVDEGRRLLLRNGEIVPMTSKVFDTLLILIENRDRVLEKNELMQRLWPASHVEEGNLTVNVSHLRKALDDTHSERRFIVTIPGHGYRFVGEVREGHGGKNGAGSEELPTAPDTGTKAGPVPTASAAPAPGRVRKLAAGFSAIVALAAVAAFLLQARSAGSPATTTVPARSIAILPFKPLADRENDAYLGLGMADALITKLSGIRQLTVRPTSAILNYGDSRRSSLDIGREQRVDAVLEGTIERADERVRMTVRLLNVRDGAALWSYQSEESESRDLFALQDLLSEKIADALLVRLTGSERRSLRKHYTEEPAAYDAYVKGRYFWNQRTADGLRTAIDLFGSAVRKDPKYALAYAGLADCYSLAVWYVPMPASEAVPKLSEAATRALALDPQLAEAHLGMGSVYSFRWDWPGARRELERAIALNPGHATARHWYSLNLALTGEFDEAIRQAQKARELDPLSLSINTDLGWVEYLARRYESAIDAYRSTLEMDPNFSLTHFDLALAYSAVGRHAEAVAEMRKASARGSDYWAGLGYVCGAAGRRGEALAALQELTALSKSRYVPPYHFAWIYAGLGDRDRAIAELEKVYREHTQHVVDFKTVPMFDTLRSDPRYADLVRRVGL